MNVITISNLDQFNLILNDLLCLSEEQSEEIYHNMWCISLEGDLIEKITLRQLRYFVDTLIENREQQLKNINVHRNAAFYMWFDQQALQLRFNVITGDVNSLPFGCKIRVNNTYEVILDNFINTVRDVAQSGDQIEFCNSEDWEEEGEQEEEYVLDVFVKFL
jgi:hypothetical protein